MVGSRLNVEPVAREVAPVIEPAVRALCQRPYPGHPRGCPNYGKKRGCPPETPIFDQVYDLVLPVYAIVTTFNLGAHAEKMRERHPDWSWAKLSCCLYWQQGARKRLKFEIAKFLRSHPGYRAEATPEALGINVTATLQRAGFPALEWPPVHLARQVALAAVPKECPEGRMGGVVTLFGSHAISQHNWCYDAS
jgi:hypothetical protein